MNLTEWAIRWGVSAAALHDLASRMHMQDMPPSGGKPGSEANVQSRVRIEAGERGVRLFRNNVGALLDSRGVPVRYGLANESEAANKMFKSGDLIGIRPVLITGGDVGRTIGQFVSRECKAEGWRYTGTPHEEAQMRWAHLINTLGGDASFCTGEGTL